MADLIRPSLGGGNSNLVSGSFWFNTPTGNAKILDCIGLIKSTPSDSGDGNYPSLVISVLNRTLSIDCGNPDGMQAQARNFYDVDHGYQGESGDSLEIRPGSFGGDSHLYGWASANGTGPTDVAGDGGHIASLLPYDGFTYFDGWAIYGNTTKGGWIGDGTAIKSHIDALAIINGEKPSYANGRLAGQAAIDYGNSLGVDESDPTLFENSFSNASGVHHAATPPPYLPGPTCGWSSTNTACSDNNLWTHVAFCIDTSNSGPYPAPIWSGDPEGISTPPSTPPDRPDEWIEQFNAANQKTAKIVINGVYANRNFTGTDAPDYDGSDLIAYSTSFSMDFSGTGVGIPYRNSARVAVGLPTNPYIVRMADLQIWCGQYIDWTDINNFNKVVTITSGVGRPTNLAVSSAAFGAPTIRMHGNHLHFPTNLGTGGSFTEDGTITDYTPGPSYG